MILLTASDGTPVTVERSNIREVHSVGNGAIILLNVGKPMRVMQSAERVVVRWKRWTKGE